MKTSFVYYLDWAEQLLTLPAELRLKIDDAIKRYVLYGEEPTDREVLYSMFGLIRMQIDRDVEKWNGIREKRSIAGAKGAKVTNQKAAKAANADLCRQKSANPAVNANVNVNDNVSTSVDGKPTIVGKECAFSFDDFWDAYGKKVDRKKCESKWAKLTDEQRRQVMNHVPKYVTSVSGREPRYRKNPLTYLNGECWNDEIIREDSRSANALGKRTVDDYDEEDD